MGIKETLFGGKRKFALVALVVIGAILLAMGTYSFWTDSESAPGNTVQAGTLDLSIDEGASDTQYLTKLVG